jgi:dinuclear metal center YbgI/SA1388 family protein
MEKKMNAQKISKMLDNLLDVETFKDSSNNGLQVDNSGKEIKKILTGVDASQEFFEHAVALGSDMVICHHGISWGDSLKRITGLNYKNIKILMDNDIALYACHLPLDAHGVYGNNAQIVRALELKNVKPFGEYHGNVIGFSGEFGNAIKYDDFKKLVEKKISKNIQTMDFGPSEIKSVAVISGGAASDIHQAGEGGFDVYLSGEAALMAYSPAREFAVNAVFAGHYKTEVFGVKALAKFLSNEYGLDAEFLDLDIKF